jgi:exopolyphosphatase/guanosine-5'-triphosphate,3'-diphosphate pyrophosphatase
MTIDVGGGSTELIMRTATTDMRLSRSFDIGSRRVTELFLFSDPPDDTQLQKARDWIAGQTQNFISALPERPEKIIAVAGTATTAITIRDSIEVYDRRLVHGTYLRMPELEKLICDLSAMTLEQRRQVAGLHPGRAPVIVGGLIILAVIMEQLGGDGLLISDTDILQGIVLDAAAI